MITLNQNQVNLHDPACISEVMDYLGSIIESVNHQISVRFPNISVELKEVTDLTEPDHEYGFWEYRLLLTPTPNSLENDLEKAFDFLKLYFTSAYLEDGDPTYPVYASGEKILARSGEFMEVQILTPYSL